MQQEIINSTDCFTCGLPKTCSQIFHARYQGQKMTFLCCSLLLKVSDIGVNCMGDSDIQQASHSRLAHQSQATSESKL